LNCVAGPTCQGVLRHPPLHHLLAWLHGKGLHPTPLRYFFPYKKQLKVWKENQETVRLVSYPIYLYICLFGHDEQNLRISLSEIHSHDDRRFNPNYIGASFIHAIMYYYYVVMFDALFCIITESHGGKCQSLSNHGHAYPRGIQRLRPKTYNLGYTTATFMPTWTCPMPPFPKRCTLPK
jgi:hypothetical protein